MLGLLGYRGKRVSSVLRYLCAHSHRSTVSWLLSFCMWSKGKVTLFPLSTVNATFQTDI